MEKAFSLTIYLCVIKMQGGVRVLRRLNSAKTCMLPDVRLAGSDASACTDPPSYPLVVIGNGFDLCDGFDQAANLGRLALERIAGEPRVLQRVFLQIGLQRLD